MSASDPRIHFGLGKRAAVDSLEIAWPGGHIDRLAKVPIDQILAIKEDSGIVPRTLPKIVVVHQSFGKLRFFSTSATGSEGHSYIIHRGRASAAVSCVLNW